MSYTNHHRLLMAAAMEGGVPSTIAPWNPLDKASTVSLSNNNYTAQLSSGVNVKKAARCVAGKTEGSFYFEFTLDNTFVSSNENSVGLARSDRSLDLLLNDNAASGVLAVYKESSTSISINYGTSGYIYTPGLTILASDVWQLAITLGASGKIWLGRNNVWMFSGNPSTGANPKLMDFSGATWMKACSFRYASRPVTLKETPVYTPPTGFNLWSA